jgi:hypothetical protein
VNAVSACPSQAEMIAHRHVVLQVHERAAGVAGVVQGGLIAGTFDP